MCVNMDLSINKIKQKEVADIIGRHIFTLKLLGRLNRFEQYSHSYFPAPTFISSAAVSSDEFPLRGRDAELPLWPLALPGKEEGGEAAAALDEEGRDCVGFDFDEGGDENNTTLDVECVLTPLPVC